MRKGQEILLKRAEKYKFNEEQITFLKREDLKLQTLKAVFNVFSFIKDYPVDKALEYVESGKNPWALSSGKKLNYDEYMKFPEGFHNGNLALNRCALIRQKINSKDKQKTFIQFAEKYAKTFDNDKSLRDIDVFYDFYNKYYYKIIHTVSLKMMSFLNQFTIAIINRLKEESIKNCLENYKNIEQTKNFGTIWEKENIKSKIKELENDFIETHELAYNISKKYKITNAVLNKLFKNGLTPEEAVDKIISKKNETSELININVNTYKLFRGIKREYLKIEYKDEEDEKDVEKVLNNTLLDCDINIPSYHTWLSSENENNGYREFFNTEEESTKPLYVSFSYSRTIKVGSDRSGKRMIKQHYKGRKRTTFLMFGSNIYKKITAGKYIPATIKDFHDYFIKYGYKEFTDTILNLPDIKTSYVIKDLIKECNENVENGFYAFPPITWNECIGFKNKNHLMRNKYKNGQDIDWNKLGVCRGYAYMKTRPYVDDKSQGILYNAITNNIIKGYSTYNAKGFNVARSVVSVFIKDRLYETMERDDNQNEIYNIGTEVNDYVLNTLVAKEKINLRWKSLRKVQQRNTDIVLDNAHKDMTKITIPRNSKFNDLKEGLPEGFEWIKSKKRIVEEGQTMRHCVASYANYVNDDKCAIYHLDYKDRAYTVEFRLENDKYKVVQIQSKADRGASKEVWDYIENLLLNIKYDKNKKHHTSKLTVQEV